MWVELLLHAKRLYKALINELFAPCTFIYIRERCPGSYDIYREKFKQEWSQQRCMTMLLVQSCSKSKNTPDSAVPALELYSGYFFKIIKKAIREGEFRSDLDLCILSAKYGLIDATTEIEWYNQRMDAQRAEELQSEIAAALQNRVTEEYERVLVNVGQLYKRAIEDELSALDVDVQYIEGDGIGMKGSCLKRIIREDMGSKSLEISRTSGAL